MVIYYISTKYTAYLRGFTYIAELKLHTLLRGRRCSLSPVYR